MPKDEKYNIGNVPFELIIKPNSKVNILGMFDDKDVPELKYHEIELNKVDKFVGKKIGKLLDENIQGIFKLKKLFSSDACIC